MKKVNWIEILKLLFCGILIGSIIALYKYLTFIVLKGSSFLFNSEELLIRILAVLFGLVLMCFSYKLVKIDGNIQGGGLPQIEACIENKTNSIVWYKSLPLMIINSLISFFCGLPVGSEAPSAFIGAMVIKGANKYTIDYDEDIYIGMGGGVAAAFLSPLSGVFYVFEESLHHFSFKRLGKLLLVTIPAFLTSYLINKEYIIEIPIFTSFNFKYFYTLIFILILCTFLGVIIIKLVAKLKIFINNHYKNYFIKKRFFFVFIYAFNCLLFCPLLSGSGLSLIYYLNQNPVWYIILIYLIIRLTLFIFTGNAMVSGGLLVPTLAIGGMIGYLIGIISTFLFNLPKDQYPLLILLSMFTLFAIINKTPFTSFILIITTGGYQNLANFILPCLFIFICSFLIVHLLKIDNLTDTRRKLLRTSRNIN